jgi:hypothetical protein
MSQRGSIILIIPAIFILGGTFFTFFLVKKIPKKQEQTIKNHFEKILNLPQENIPTQDQEKTSPKETKIEISPTPTIKKNPLGTIKGRVQGGYYKQPLGGVKITAKGQNIQKSTVSGEDGQFLIENLPVGDYVLSFNDPKYSFSEFKISVKEGENLLSSTPHGFLKNPQPLSINGTVFADKNGNNTKDGNDEGLKSTLLLYSKVGDSWVVSSTISTDNQGSFSLQVKDIGPHKLEPTDITFYNKPNPVEFIVDGYGGEKNYMFPYYPTVSQSGFVIYVFNDKNENAIRDSDEEYIHYQYAEITNTSTGKQTKVGVGENGWEEKPADYGNYTIKLVPQDNSWSYYYKITLGEAQTVVTNTSGQSTVLLGAHKLY